MSDRVQPAFLGGLLIGVLSALPFVNSCCCLWVIGGGVLTTYLLQERLTVPVTAGNVAVTGLLAGVFGAIIAGVLGIALSLAMGTGADPFDRIPQDLPPEFNRAIEIMREWPRGVWLVLPFLTFIVIFPIFAMLGSLLGVAIFKKTPPPPPPGTVEILPPEQPPI